MNYGSKELEAQRWIYDPSLVLHLPLYKLDGGSIQSEDAYGHTCTVTAATWGTAGRTFDGTDDKIDCGTPSALNLTTALTLAATIEPTTIAGNTRVVIGKGTEAGYATFAWRIWVVATGEVAFYSSNGVDAQTFAATSTKQLAINNRYRVMATFDAAVGAYLYVNGVEWAKDETVVGSIPDNASMNLTIGARKRAVDDDFFIGVIDRVNIWNRAFNSQEALHDYLESGLV